MEAPNATRPSVKPSANGGCPAGPDASVPGRLHALLGRHWEVFRYVCTVIFPVILRTGRRPVIFSRYSGLGDIICTVPAARQLMERHPGATFIYNCHPESADIPRLAAIATRVTALKPIGLLGHWYRFLLGGYYHFAHGDDSAQGGCREPLVTEFCRQFDLRLEEEHPHLQASSETLARVSQKLREVGLTLENLVLLHSGPSWPVREWPAANWRQLVGILRIEGFVSIGQLGVSRHLSFGEVNVNAIPGTVSLLNAFTVEECIAAISLANLFIGIDSGLLHIAAATKTRSVGMFGPTLPSVRFSEAFRNDLLVGRVDCAGCEHRKPQLHWVTGCPFNIECMKTLEPEEIAALGVAALKEKPNGVESLPPRDHPPANASDQAS